MFCHHATNLQDNVSCKLCIKTTSSNNGLMKHVYAMCSLLVNNVRSNIYDLKKWNSPPPAAMLLEWLPGDTRVCVSPDEGLLPSLSREELESDSID